MGSSQGDRPCWSGRYDRAWPPETTTRCRHRGELPRHPVSVVREIDDDREVNVDRLTILHAGLVAPLADRLDRRLLEPAVAARALQHLDMPDAAVLADDRLEHDSPQNSLPLGGLGESRLDLGAFDDFRILDVADACYKLAFGRVALGWCRRHR